MSDNSRKSAFSFEEGHKRETRKSYQAYMEEFIEQKKGNLFFVYLHQTRLSITLKHLINNIFFLFVLFYRQ